MSDPVEYVSDKQAEDERTPFTAPGWWFWDETWTDVHGPYAIEEEARKKLREYAATL